MGTHGTTVVELNALLNTMNERMGRMEATITALTEENKELRAQLAEPSTSGSNNGLAQSLKELFVSEKRVKIPKPHDYDGDKQKLPTFCREAETYIIDQGLDTRADTEKAINVIAGYLTGNAATWYTIAYHTCLTNKSKWETHEDFWKEMKARFGDANPTFTARTKLS